MKVVLVLLDGVGDDVARDRTGYLEHLVERGTANRFSSRAALPTISRPNYETIHTGLSPNVHGITSNHDVRQSTSPNIFHLRSEAGISTGAVPYRPPTARSVGRTRSSTKPRSRRQSANCSGSTRPARWSSTLSSSGPTAVIRISIEEARRLRDDGNPATLRLIVPLGKTSTTTAPLSSELSSCPSAIVNGQDSPNRLADDVRLLGDQGVWALCRTSHRRRLGSRLEESRPTVLVADRPHCHPLLQGRGRGRSPNSFAPL